MEREIFCIPLRFIPKNSRIHPSVPPTTRKGLRPLQPRNEERTACLPPTFLASFAEPPAHSFRQARSLEAEATITPRCARRHRVPGKPTNPAHHHKGRCPLHPRVRRLTSDGSLAAHDDEEKFQKKQANVGFVACEISGRRSRTPCRVRAGSHGDHHDSHGERESLHSILAKRRISATMELRSGECGSVPLREGALMSFSPLRGEKLRA